MDCWTWKNWYHDGGFHVVGTATLLCQGKGTWKSLHYKLMMFRVPLTGAANVFCENQGVVNNTTSPKSILSKKHNQICYHRVREHQWQASFKLQKKTWRTIWWTFIPSPLDYLRDVFYCRGSCTEGSWGHFTHAQVYSWNVGTDSFWSSLQDPGGFL